MSLISNYEYIRDWCNHRFLKKSDQVQVDLSNYYTKSEVDSTIDSAIEGVDVTSQLASVATSGNFLDLSTNKPDRIYYGVCSASSAAAIKDVTLYYPMGSLYSGDILLVKFTNGTNHPTSTNQIRINGMFIKDIENADFGIGDMVMFRYDGTKWIQLAILNRGKGILNTNNSTTLTPDNEWWRDNVINLHKISKTGSYIDLLNKPNVYAFVCSTAAGTAIKVATTTNWGSDFAVPAGTVVAIYFNNTNTAAVVDLQLQVGSTVGHIKRSVNGSLVNLRSTDSLKTKETYWFNYDGTYWVLMNDDTTPGTLTTTSTTALSTATNETLSGSISLHKVSKTGNYNDLLNTPTIPTTTSSVASGSTAALTSGGAYTALSAKEDTSNKVTSISASSTDTQYPSAKAVYTQIGNIETILDQIIQPTS